MVSIIIAASVLGVAQLPGLDKRLPGIPGLDAIFKKGPAITTSLKDCKWEAADKDEFNPNCSDLFELEKTSDHGFILKAGGWTAELQSYCLKAGTHGPGDGDGYLYAPPKGPYEKIVIACVRNSVEHPEIKQREIQVLLWAMIARTKFSDMPRAMQATAAKLLTTKQLVDLNGGALGVLTDDKLAGAFIKEPAILRQAYEAEARIRNTLSRPDATFEDLERIAMLTGQAPWGPDSRETPSGRWSLHPDGYYVRYIPSGYSRTQLQIYVEKGSAAEGKVFNPSTHIAVPGNTARQRLIQSARKWGED